MTDKPRIVITRDPERTQLWARRLESEGYPVLELPLLRFEAIAPDTELRNQSFDWILFTSPQGVRAFLGADLNPRGARLGTLGQGTAGVVAELGLTDHLGIAARDGRELANAFVALAPEGSTVLLPGPRQRGPEVEQILTEAGYQVTMAPLYETLPVPPQDLPADPWQPGDLVFFCSPSTVRAFCGKWESRPRAVAIGETTAQAAIKAGFETVVAATPDLDAMLRAAGLEPLKPQPSPEDRS